jgi:hypothetical protein
MVAVNVVPGAGNAEFEHAVVNVERLYPYYTIGLTADSSRDAGIGSVDPK